MDLQVHNSRSQQGFMVPRKPKAKKTNQHVNYVQSNFNKNVEAVPKKSHKQQYSQGSYGYPQQKHAQYPSWEVFDSNRGKTRGNYSNGYNKYEDQYNQSYYAKNLNLNYRGSSSEKASRSTGISDNDNGKTDIYSDLAGFKIVQNGKIVYDETQEDFGLSDSESEEVLPTKFASSLYTIGPNAKDISLPSFA